jgi:hypothetical protein
MTDTQQFNVRLEQPVIDEIRARAKRGRMTQSAVIANAIACGCDGRGIVGWHAGNWVYCTCLLGISCAMNDLNKAIQIFAEDLATMPEAESNRREREIKERHYQMMLDHYDTLEREYERLSQ